MTPLLPGITFTAQHTELATAAAIAWEDYTRHKQDSAEVIDFESSCQALPGRITVLVLIAALCEAMANIYLSVIMNAHDFELFSYKGPVEKWTRVFPKIVPGYTLAKKDQTTKDLRFLFECRNAIMHAKPTVSLSDEIIHLGTAERFGSIAEVTIARVWTLPRRLIDNLGKFDPMGAGALNSSVSTYFTDFRLKEGLAPVVGTNSTLEVLSDEKDGPLSFVRVAKFYELETDALSQSLGLKHDEAIANPTALRLQPLLRPFAEVARLRAMDEDGTIFRNWIRARHPLLGGRTPLAALLAGDFDKVVTFAAKALAEEVARQFSP